MKAPTEEPIFFETAKQFHSWLNKHHSTRQEQWIGFHRKASGLPSISWPEAVDEALCFGWIDGLRKTVDGNSYKIRFTPRRPTSTWSAINIRRMAELTREGRVHRAGLDAFGRRIASKSGIYAYENRRAAVLSDAAERQFRLARPAWDWFQTQAPSYRQTAIWWVVSAKRPETQQKRLAVLIANSKTKRKIGPLQYPRLS